MLAMQLQAVRQPLLSVDLPIPAPAKRSFAKGEGLRRMPYHLHIVDGELPLTRTPIVPGHEIVGVVVANGSGCSAFRLERAGRALAWRKLRQLPILRGRARKSVRASGLYRLRPGRRVRRICCCG